MDYSKQIGRPTGRLLRIALLLALVLNLLPGLVGISTPVAEAHNLDQRMSWLQYDATTRAMLDSRIAANDPQLFKVGDEVGMLIKVVPTDGTTTGAGGYVTFYVPAGVQVVGTGYMAPDGNGNYNLVPMKGQSIAPLGYGPIGPASTPQLVGLTLGPNAVGQTSAAVSSTGVHWGTLAGVYGDTGIFYSTSADTIWQSWVGSNPPLGTTIKNNSGDLMVPNNKWDAEQMYAWGISSPVAPIVDPNGRGSAPWGTASAVAGPHSGYAWQFDKDIWDASAKDAASMRASITTGPWNRIQYPGSQIGKDTPGSANNTLGFVGVDAGTMGHALSSANPLPANTNAVRWSVGALIMNRSEYAWVKVKLLDPTPYTNCAVFRADTFGGDAGGENGGKDHLWRYYDPTSASLNACLYVGKRASREIIPSSGVFQYTVDVVNTSANTTMTNVQIQDLLPSGVTFLSATPTQNSGPNPLQWNLTSLTPGKRFQATVTVQAKSTGLITNQVTVTSNQMTGSAKDDSFVGSMPLLAQNKTATPTAIAPGGNVQYTIQIDNIGTASSSSPVKLTEYLPAGFTYLSLNSVTINGANGLGLTTVNSTNPAQPIFTVSQAIQSGKSLLLTFTAKSSAGIASGTYCNSYTSETSTLNATGSLACVTVGGGRIGDTVFADWNNNGVQDPDEEGIPGVTVSLNGGAQTAVTDANGNYLFTGLVAGNYSVQVIGGIPAGYTLTTANNPTNVTLATNEQRLNVDFGYKPGGTGSIGDFVFEDKGNDGSYDSGLGDVGINGATVRLYEDTNGNGVIDAGQDALVATQTTVNGTYNFTGLATGKSYVVDVLDSNITSYFSGSTAWIASTPDPRPVPNLTGAVTNADFGFYKIVPGSIGDEVFIDGNNNGVYDNGETLIPFITVNLYRDSNGNGVLDGGEPLLKTASTSITGTYTFGELGAGNYIVDVDQNDPDLPAGYFPGKDLIPVSLGISEVRTDVDFPFQLLISKQASKTYVNAGETVAYTVSVSYPGSQLLTNVIVTDSVPAGSTYAGNASPVPTSQPGIGGTGIVQWNLGSNAPGVPASTTSGYLCVVNTNIPVSADTYVREDSAGNNYGATTKLETNPDNNGVGSSERHGLLRFSMASIPADATITAATLRMTNTSARSNHTLDVRESLRAWTEGTLNNNTCVAGASWNAPNCTDTATGWNGSGGNFRTTPSPWGATSLGSLSAATTGLKTASSSALAQIVQDWVTGAKTNNGFVLLATGIDNGQADWAVKEAGNGAVLNVVYQMTRTQGCPTSLSYSPAADTYVREDSPDKNFGVTAKIETNPDNNGAGSSERHWLLRFDLSSIPSDATISSTTLKATNTAARSNHTIEVREALRSWTEGSLDNGTCVGTGASWLAPNCTDTATGWNGSGGNFRSSPSPWGATLLGTLDPSTTGMKSTSDANLTQIVQDWVSGTKTNRGFVMLATGTDTGSADWGVKEAGNGPALDITYSSPLVTVEIPVNFDTYVREDSAVNNYGATVKMETNPDNNSAGSSERHGLIKFDVSWLPAGATITSATLRMTNTSARNNHILEVREAIMGWTEGTLNNSTCVAGASWNAPNCTDTATGWNGSGGNFRTAPSPWGASALGSFDASTTGQKSTSSAGLAQLVQAWVSGTKTNNGIVLLATGIDNGNADWGVREAGNGALLTIQYQSPSTGVGTTSALTATPSLVTSGSQISVRLQVTAGQSVASVVAGSLTITPTNGASASCGSASPASQTVNPGTTATFTWLCTATAGANPGSLTFRASASGSGTNFAAATSNSVLVAPPLRFSVTATGATPYIRNQAWISSAALISPTPSNRVDTALTASIGDLVWADLNGNGVRDGGEPGLSGVQVCATNGSTTVCETTDGSGAYRIFGLPPGNWTVSTTPSTQPAGYSATTAISLNVSLAAAQQYDAADFGLRPPAQGRIGDTVWLDKNEDGVLDAGESGLPGVRVNLYNGTGTTLLATTTTNASGYYTFTGLYAGSYQVRVDETSVVTSSFGVTSTIAASMDRVGGTLNPRNVALATDTSVVSTADFGYNWGGSIGDYVWYDNNGNKVQEGTPPDAGGANAVVLLLYYDLDGNGEFDPGTDTPVDFTQSNSSGIYLFDNLPPGKYIVKAEEQTVAAPPGSANAGQFGVMVATTGTKKAINLAANEDYMLADFGFIEAGELEGTVFHDVDSSGNLGGGEPGLTPVTVMLTGVSVSGSPISLSVDTDADGEYKFIVPPGTYTITYDVADVLAIDGTLTTATTPISLTTGVAAGQEVEGLDFGVDHSGKVGDTVFLDADGNGSQSSSEPGIVGVTVELRDAGNNLLGVAVTDSEGKYLFVGLPNGSYTVTVQEGAGTPINGYTRTAGSNPRTATVSGGGQDLSADFGYQPPVITRTIGGRVYNDANNNGDDNSEPGFPNVTVSVTCGGTVYTTLSDGTGNWQISGIPNGSSCTLLDADETALPSASFVATETPATPFSVNGNITGLDFGYNLRPGSISGTVCLGTGDGICSANESVLPGVTLTLTYAGDDGFLGTGDDIVQSMLSDGSGYTFGNLEAGLYRIDSTNLPGYASVADADGGNPDSIIVTLAPSQNVVGRDFEDSLIIVPAPNYVLTKTRNGFDSVRKGETISFTIRITNTGNVPLNVLPLRDVYVDGFLVYIGASPAPDLPNPGQMEWTDLTGNAGSGFGADLQPGSSFVVDVYFVGTMDTTGLPGGVTENTATVQGAYYDPDGPGGTPQVNAPDKTAKASVQVIASTAVALANSTLAYADNAAHIGWQTVNESDLIGFFLYRSADDGAQERVNGEMIPARKPGQSDGATYSFTDSVVEAGRRYSYAVEFVGVDGPLGREAIGDLFTGARIFLPTVGK